MSLKTRPVETVANPAVVENLPADIVSLTEAQSLGHQTFQLTVAEPVRRNDNSPCLNCKSVILSNENQKQEGFWEKDNPVGMGIALPIGQGHNRGMLLDSRPSKDSV